MTSQRIPLIAGNWKMNLDHEAGTNHVQALLENIQGLDYAATEVVIFPPFTDIRSLQTYLSGEKTELQIGGQDLSPEDSGAFTGDTSGHFLEKLGCTYVLVGHSERRVNHNETDELCAKKVEAAVRNDLIALLCVGEDLEKRENDEHVAHTIQQVNAGLAKISVEELEMVVIAYEPVWAIGTGKVATTEDAQLMAQAIRDNISTEYGQEAADSMRILYGGSVKGANAAEIISQPDIDGVLVGGASLDAQDFAKIIKR